MTFSARSAADSLCRALDAMTVSYERRGSGLSGSQYVTVDDLKVRFATHEARPTYEALNGAASCEIGTHMMAASTDWKRALAYLCYTLELTPPRRYASFVAAYRAERLAKIERERVEASPEYRADCERRIADRVTGDRARRDADWRLVEPHLAVVKEFDARSLAGDLAGKKQRDQRRAARRRLETAIGLPEVRIREAMWGRTNV